MAEKGNFKLLINKEDLKKLQGILGKSRVMMI